MPRSQSQSSAVVRGRSRTTEKVSEERRGGEEGGVESVQEGDAADVGEGGEEAVDEAVVVELVGVDGPAKVDSVVWVAVEV